MPYCARCGEKLPEGASFCPRCGSPVDLLSQPILASWADRFIAWLIDVIVIGVLLGWWTMWIWTFPGYMMIPHIPRWIPFADLGTRNILYFLYWTFMEGAFGQSIGKIVMKIKVTRLDGKPIGMGQAAIESIGKSFLLPIDCLIGWIFFSSKKQRLFNYISETIIVKMR